MGTTRAYRPQPATRITGRHNAFAYGLKVLLLLLAMAGSLALFAQNTGAGPYVDSWHTYRITVGNSANTVEWEIINADTTVVRPLSDAMQWVAIPALVGNIADISVCFTDSVFGAGERWYLRYREYNGAGTCVAARRFSIDLTDNDFYLSLAANDTICKPQSGQVFDWTNVDDETFTTEFTYRVTLNKVPGYVINSWSFVADIDLDPGTHSFESYTVNVIPAAEGTATITDDGTWDPLLDGLFRVSMTAPTTPDITSLSVDIVVTIRGLLHDGLRATLTLLNGQATHGVNSNITYDNEGKPREAEGVTDVALQDRIQIVMIDPLPDTENILPGAGETVASATNPLQNSTHRYTVVMGNIANYNSGNNWSIFNVATSSVQIGGFTLTPTASATADTATIRFTDTMLTGDYILYYTEESADGCIARRAYPFTLQGPFDVDIASVSSDCPDSSGIVFNDLTASNTVIDYVVTLNTVSYGADWSFDFTLISTPNFDAADFDVLGISFSVGTPTGTGYTRSVAVPSTDTEVTITVTYNGYYENAHLVRAALTNITGSFNEDDADATNYIEHTIYSIPQAGELVGVN
jgi:hypothetical protein